MFRSAQHDRGERRFNVLTNHSGFNTNVRSTRFPFATLKPLTVKDFQFCGTFGKTMPATGIGKTINRGPGMFMNSAARRLFTGIRKPVTRERKYQTRLGSSNSTEANCMFGLNSVRD